MKDIVKLGTLGDIFIGLTYRPEDVANEGTIVLRSSNIQNGKLDFADIVRVKCKVRENLIVKPNDILMCSRNGSAKLVGKCTLLPKMDEEMSFGAFMTIIRTHHNPYLVHFFNSNAFRGQLGRAATTTINQITRRMLDDISVPLYPKEQEDYIVSLFNQIDELIWAETKKLDLLDELVKSRFIELFGDPEDSTTEWERTAFSSVCIDMHQGINTVADKVEYVNSGLPIIQSKNITSGYLDLEDVRYVTESDYEYYRNKYNPKPSDLLVCNIGTIGKSLIVENEVDFLIAWNLFLIKLNKELVNPIFVKVFIELLNQQNYFEKYMTGGTVKFVNKKTMGNISTPLPPMALQEQFVAFVEQTDKSKMAIQQSLDKLETLKKSLMQEYFG